MRGFLSPKMLQAERESKRLWRDRLTKEEDGRESGDRMISLSFLSLEKNTGGEGEGVR